MKTVDALSVAAPADVVYQAAADVERWPGILPHYRWVRELERAGPDSSVVEMAAWRPFGVLRWPAWWVSEMRVDREKRSIRYRHIRGITRGMDVEWSIVSTATGCDVTIIHEWPGPRWPVIGGAIASLIIGPVFIHGIASRTLAGIARAVVP